MFNAVFIRLIMMIGNIALLNNKKVFETLIGNYGIHF